MAEWFYGKGPAFPFKRTSGGDFAMAEGIALVEMGLEQAIRIEIGQRPMQKQKGNRMNKLLFSLEGTQRDMATAEYIKLAVKDAEPRVIINEVTVLDGEDAKNVIVNIDYKLINENVSRNKVVRIPVGG